MREKGCSFVVQLNMCDEYYSYLDEIKKILKEYKVYLLTEQHLLDNSIVSYITDIYKYLEYLNEDCFKIK